MSGWNGSGGRRFSESDSEPRTAGVSMENYLGLIEAGFVFLVLIGIAVIELVSLRIDKKRKDAEAKKSKRES